MREQAPVNAVTMLNGRVMWMVFGYAEARTVLSDPRFSSDRFRYGTARQDIPEKVRKKLLDERSRAGSFISMDPPEHTRYRKLLTGQFTVRRMRQLAPRIEEIVTEHLDAMLAAGTSADLVTAFALPFPSLVICELLGVRYSDRAEFQRRTSTMLRLDTSFEELLRVRDEMREFMLSLVTEKRECPSDDLLSGLIHDNGAHTALTDDELVNIATLLLVAGHETTANMLGLGTFALLEHPEQLEALRADPSLIDNAVEELLRHLSIVHLGIFRVTTEGVELGGQQIPAGQTVLVSLPLANRDPEHWVSPAALDVSRGRSPHLAFGHGVHQCLGQQLARVEMTIGFTHLVKRLPNLRLAVPAAEVPLRGDMAIYGVHALPVAWDDPKTAR
jgi:cytochrome P450